MNTRNRLAATIVAVTLTVGLAGAGVAAASVYPEGRALHQPQKPPVVLQARGSSWT